LKADIFLPSNFLFWIMNTDQKPETEADRIRADLAANAAKAHWHQANDRAALLQQNKLPERFKNP